MQNHRVTEHCWVWTKINRRWKPGSRWTPKLPSAGCSRLCNELWYRSWMTVKGGKNSLNHQVSSWNVFSQGTVNKTVEQFSMTKKHQWGYKYFTQQPPSRQQLFFIPSLKQRPWNLFGPLRGENQIIFCNIHVFVFNTSINQSFVGLFNPFTGKTEGFPSLFLDESANPIWALNKKPRRKGSKSSKALCCFFFFKRKPCKST